MPLVLEFAHPLVHFSLHQVKVSLLATLLTFCSPKPAVQMDIGRASFLWLWIVLDWDLLRFTNSRKQFNLSKVLSSKVRPWIEVPILERSRAYPSAVSFRKISICTKMHIVSSCFICISWVTCAQDHANKLLTHPWSAPHLPLGQL